MLKITRQSITLTKGDDASIRLIPKYKDGTLYEVQEGDRAKFRIKIKDTLKEFDCAINTDNNKIIVTFTADDTADVEPGIYRYEAELITSFGFHYTFIADQTFIIGKEYEVRLTGSSAAGTAANGNYPGIDGEIPEEPVVNGELQPTNPSMDYRELSHKPTLNGHMIIGDQTNADLGIPTKTSDLENDLDFVSDNTYVHTDNNYDDEAKAKVDTLGGAAFYDVPESGNAGTEEVVLGSDTRLSDARNAADVYPWAKAETKPTYNYSEIQNTPTLGTAAAKNVPAIGDAANGEVVLGNDSRLTDARNAADVYSWAKAETKPTYNYSEIQNTPSLGTAAAKNFITSVLDGSGDLVTGGAVKSAIDSAVASAYKASGNKTCAELVSALLVEANLGNVYNMSDSGTTTADFVEGAGKAIEAGDNVAIVLVNGAYKFDLLSGMVDLSNYIQKSATNGLVKNDGSIDATTYQPTETGKGLSTNDYTTTEKDKLAGIAAGAEVNVQSDWNQSSSSADDYIKNKPQNLVQDAAYVHTDNNYTSNEKTKLSGIAAGAEVNVQSDWSQSDTGADDYIKNKPENLVQDAAYVHTDNNYDATAQGIVDGVTTALSGKVDKENGKGLSSNDYTSTEKTKLSGIATGATKTEASTTNGNIKINGSETTVYNDSAFRALGLSVVNGMVCQTYNT